MAVIVFIPQQLQKLTGGKDAIEVLPGTILDIVKEIEKQFPGFSERITKEGKLSKFVNFYVNEEDIRFLKGDETTTKDGSVVSIVPALAGG